jgi:hypothetical protein
MCSLRKQKQITLYICTKMWYQSLHSGLLLKSDMSMQTSELPNQGSSVTKCGMMHIVSMYRCNKNKLYTLSNKNQAASDFVKFHSTSDTMYSCHHNLSHLYSPYFCIHDVSLSSIQYNHSHGIYINQKTTIHLLNFKLKHASITFIIWLTRLKPLHFSCIRKILSMPSFGEEVK